VNSTCECVDATETAVCSGNTLYWLDSCGIIDLANVSTDCEHECIVNECTCVPKCAGKQCGDDGCDGSCGSCDDDNPCTSNSCSNGSCEYPNVTDGKSCGSGNWCQSGSCECKPACSGKECGDDGCGGSCGTCDSPQTYTCGGGECVLRSGLWVDSATGLVWQDPPTAGSKAWQAAKDFCSANTAGLSGSGWRLPTISETRSLVRGCTKTVTNGACGVTDSCLIVSCWSIAGCSGCDPWGGTAGGCYWDEDLGGDCGMYWSSSPDGSNASNAWIQGYHDGGVVTGGKTLNNKVRCVRSGP